MGAAVSGGEGRQGEHSVARIGHILTPCETCPTTNLEANRAGVFIFFPIPNMRLNFRLTEGGPHQLFGVLLRKYGDNTVIKELLFQKSGQNERSSRE